MDQFETLAYPDESTIRRIVAKFESNGSVNPAHTVIKYSTRNIPDNVQQYICANMKFNSRNQPKRLAHELGISDRSVRKILKSNGYKRYKPQFHQQLINNDNQRRLQFCTRMRNGPGIIPPIDDICFSDEATVYIRDEPNRQLVRFWSRSRPDAAVIASRTQYQAKVNVWAGLVGSRIIGPYIIDGNLNGPKYEQLLRNEAIPCIRKAEQITGVCCIFKNYYYQNRECNKIVYYTWNKKIP